jgi:hypothetical protein
MSDLDATALSLADRLSRQQLIAWFSQQRDGAEAVARGLMNLGGRRTIERRVKEGDAWSAFHHMSRMLFFLQHDVIAPEASKAERVLCEELRRRVKARAAW